MNDTATTYPACGTCEPETCNQGTCPKDIEVARPFATAGNNRLVTVYWMGEMGMGVRRAEGRLLEFGRLKYAQYPAAPFVRFIPARKRNAVGFVQTYQPFLVIVEGKGPEPRDPWGSTEQRNGCTVSQMRHSGFSSAWRSEADELIASIPADRIIFDGRG